MAHKYTQEEIQFLKEYAWGHSWKEITEEFNRRFNANCSVKAISGQLKRRGFKTGRTGRFESGLVSYNKGKKMSYEQYEKAKPTMFKEGNVPHNTLPIGTEKMLADGYIWVKVDNVPRAKKQVNWKQKHRMIWEEAHGPIPKGHVVIFLDGDRTNTVLDNLAMIPQKVLSRLNQGHLIFDDAEKTKVGVGIAEVLAKIGDLKNDKK